MPDAVEEYFDGKPASLSIFRAIADVIDGYGTSAMTVGSQISFGRERKFAWFWLYNVTKKNPDGVPHLMLAIDHGVDSEHVRNVEQIGKSRWNHQIVVRTLGDARSPWLAKLVGLRMTTAAVDNRCNMASGHAGAGLAIDADEASRYRRFKLRHYRREFPDRA